MLRLLFYCLNVTGLGHIVRSIQIARAAYRLGDCECTLVAGCPYLDHLRIDPNLKLERLPPVYMEDGIRLRALDPALANANVSQVRGERILALCRSTQPHVVLIDHQPTGMAGELMPTFNAAIEEGWPTRFIWGIPYVDGGFGGRRPPGNPRIARALGHLHSAMAYVDPQDVEVLSQYPEWAIPEKRTYTGFVVDPPPDSLPPTPGLVVVTCGGGGEHAESLCSLALEARKASRNPESMRLRFVLGPMTDAEPILKLMEGKERVEVLRTAPVREAVRDASVVVARCGYNSSSMLIQTDLPVVFVPTGRDQRPRAARFAGHPGVWHVVQEEEGAAVRLAEALDTGIAQGRAARGLNWRVNGAVEAAKWVHAAAREAEREGGSAWAGAGG